MKGLIKSAFYRFSKNIFFWLIFIGMLGYGIYLTQKALSNPLSTGYTQFLTGMDGSPAVYFGFIAAVALYAIKCFNSESLKNRITYIGSRGSLFVAETFSAIGLVTLVCLAQFIAVAIPGLFMFYFGQVVTAEVIGSMLARFGLFLLICGMQGALMVFLGCVFYRPAGAITAFIFYDIITFLIWTLRSLMPEKAQPVFEKSVAFLTLNAISRGDFSTEDFLLSLVVVVLTALLWLGLGYVFFVKRKDL